MSLKEKEVEALNRLVKYGEVNGVYVATSGGKDSVVVHHLAKKVFGASVPLIHTPKVEGFNRVHPATVTFLYEQSAKYGMHMIPSFMMKEFLQREGLYIQIDGTRRSEFDRSDRSSDVMVDGVLISRANMPVYTRGGLFGNDSIFPIVDWSDDDVWEYIRKERIEVTEEYNILAACG